MTDFESLVPHNEAALASLLGDRDPHILFADELNFIEPYRAGVHPDQFTLHRWSTDDGSQVQQFTLRRRSPEETVEEHLSGMRAECFVVGQGIPETPGFPAQPEMIYRGIVSREEALQEALDWLTENDDGRDHTRDGEHEDMNGVVGIFDGGNGAVAVTGIGAAIFGEHIRAMQERGATYVPIDD